MLRAGELHHSIDETLAKAGAAMLRRNDNRSQKPAIPIYLQSGGADHATILPCDERAVAVPIEVVEGKKIRQQQLVDRLEIAASRRFDIERQPCAHERDPLKLAGRSVFVSRRISIIACRSAAVR